MRFIIVTYNTKHGQAAFETLEVKPKPGDTPEEMLKRAQAHADEYATDRDLILVDVDTATNYHELASRALYDVPDLTVFNLKG